MDYDTDAMPAVVGPAMIIVYWGGKFWVMHDGPGTRIAWSKNGFDWDTADSSAMIKGSHHRMGFYVASNGRLLGSH